MPDILIRSICGDANGGGSAMMKCERCPARPFSREKECCKCCLRRDLKGELLKRCSEVFYEPEKIFKEKVK